MSSTLRPCVSRFPIKPEWICVPCLLRARSHNPVEQIALEGGVALFDNGLDLERVRLELVAL